jgi:DNA-binding CsgD family transcriptional regulator
MTLEGMKSVNLATVFFSAGLALMGVCHEKEGALEQPEYGLTPHELRLLGLIVEGHSYKTAAGKLRVSVNTVAFHIQNIYGKLSVHSKAEAVAKALNEGLLP